MASDKPGAPVGALREAARAYVDATSLREAARRIGMSPTGLRGFIEGAAPYLKTERKLNAWLVNEAGRESREPVSAPAAGAALALLVAHLPPTHRDDAAGAVLDVLERATRAAGAAVPAWLGEVRRRGFAD